MFFLTRVFLIENFNHDSKEKQKSEAILLFLANLKIKFDNFLN